MIRGLVYLLIFLIPINLYAACSAAGSTVVYVNGIFTSKEKAMIDLEELRDAYIERTQETDVFFINGFNVSHLEGAGDVIQTVAQMNGKSVSNYDLNEILLQIHPQIQTRKVLLVGHSQGTFYTNEIYRYFLRMEFRRALLESITLPPLQITLKAMVSTSIPTKTHF
jgi:hypothetical protein